MEAKKERELSDNTRSSEVGYNDRVSGDELYKKAPPDWRAEKEERKLYKQAAAKASIKKEAI